MSATSSGGFIGGSVSGSVVGGGGGGSVSDGSDAGESSQSTVTISDSPSTSFQVHHENITKISLAEPVAAVGATAAAAAAAVGASGGGGGGEIQVDMSGSKMNLTVDERQEVDGVVNMGFDQEEGANRGGAEFKSLNGSNKADKVPEAVNLELVNMVPYSNGNGTSYGVPVNGIPVKKDTEGADMSSPYDEYFVPVNEHKKYMRGEKLYVTKDKRRPASWRRCLSWIVACAVISVVLIVAILAGTGVILSQEPNMVQEASVGRNFAGANLKHSGSEESTSSDSLGLNTNGSWLSSTNYTSQNVPRSIESELMIDNLEWIPAFLDQNSTEYQQLSHTLEEQLKMILFDKRFGESNIGLNVVNISHNPMKVLYRIGWNSKEGTDNSMEIITVENIKSRLIEALNKNQGYIDKYHINSDAINVGYVLNICQVNNGGCSHICYYNYLNQRFTCTCPTNLVLDSDSKTCVEWRDSFEEDYVSVPNQETGVQFESGVPENNNTHHHQHHHHHHPAGTQHEVQQTPEMGQTTFGHGFQSTKHDGFDDEYAESSSESTLGGAVQSVDVQHQGDVVNSEGGNADKAIHGSKEHDSSLDKNQSEPSTQISGSTDHYYHGTHNGESGTDKQSYGVIHGTDVNSTIDKSQVHSTAAMPMNSNHHHHHQHVDGDTKSQNNGNEEQEQNINIYGTGFGTPTEQQEHEMDQTKSHSHIGEHDHGNHYVESNIPTNSQEFEKSYVNIHGAHSGTGANEQQHVKVEDHSTGGIYFGSSEPHSEGTEPPAENGFTNMHGGVAGTSTKQEQEINDNNNSHPGNGVRFSSDHHHHHHHHGGVEDDYTTEVAGKVFGSHYSGEDVVRNKSQSNPTAEVVSDSTRPDHNVNGEPSKDIDRTRIETTTSEVRKESNIKTDIEMESSSISRGLGTSGIVTTPEIHSTDHEHVATNEGAHVSVTGDEETTTVNNKFHSNSVRIMGTPTAESAPESATHSNSQAALDGNYDVNYNKDLRGSKTKEMEQTADGTQSPVFGMHDTEYTTQMGVVQGSIINSASGSVYQPSSEHVEMHQKTSGDLKPDMSDSTTVLPTGSNNPSTLDNAKTVEGKTVENLYVMKHDVEGATPSQDKKNEQDTVSATVKSGSEDVNFGHHVPLSEETLTGNSSPVVTSNVGNTTFSINGQYPVENVHISEEDKSDVQKATVNKTSPNVTQDNPNSVPVKLPESFSKHENENNKSEQETNTRVVNAGIDSVTGTFKSDSMPPTYSTSIKGSHHEEHSINSTHQIPDAGLNNENTDRPHSAMDNLDGIDHTVKENRLKEQEVINRKTLVDNFPSTPKNIEEHSSHAMEHSTVALDPVNTNTKVNIENASEGSVSVTETTPHEHDVHVGTMNPDYITTAFSVNEPEPKIKNRNENQQNPSTQHSESVNENAQSPALSGLGAKVSETAEKETKDGLKSGELPAEESTKTLGNNGQELGKGNSNQYTSHGTSEWVAETDVTTLHPNPSVSDVTDHDGNRKLTQSQLPDDQLIVHGGPSTTIIKPSDEFFNNIKDEGIENDEFNTLIDADYKPINEYPNNGKDVLNKYANKQTFLKGDKKKLKDIVKVEKTDLDKKGGEDSSKPLATEEYSLRKHFAGNSFNVGYNIQTEQTTENAGKTDEIPGLTFQQHDVNGHDFRILHTVSPGSETETPTQVNENAEYETESPRTDEKGNESKAEKDHSKFDKDVKHPKGAKKKELKKKVGTKDGKNVEIEEGRKHNGGIHSGEGSEEDWNDFVDMTVTPPEESITTQSASAESGYSFDTGSESNRSFKDGHGETMSHGGTTEFHPAQNTAAVATEESLMANTNVGESKTGTTITTTTLRKQVPGGTVVAETEKYGSDIAGRTVGVTNVEVHGSSTGSTSPGTHQSGAESSQVKTGENVPEISGETSNGKIGGMHTLTTGQSGTLNSENDGTPKSVVREGFEAASVVPASSGSRTIERNQEGVITRPDGSVTSSGTEFNVKHLRTGTNVYPGGEQRELNGFRNSEITVHELPGTVYDGMTIKTVTYNKDGDDETFTVDKVNNEHTTDSVFFGVRNATVTRPTVVIQDSVHTSSGGQTGLPQGGHGIRISNFTTYTLGNGTIPIIRTINTTRLPSGVSYTVRNYTYATRNPTVVVRQHNTSLPDSRVIRFNTTSHTFVTSPGDYRDSVTLGNTTVYKIGNTTISGSVFDENFNPADGQYHLLTNSSGTFVYSNSQPSFVIKGNSGDFGRSGVYILGNRTIYRNNSSIPPKSNHFVFKNPTLYTVRNATQNGLPYATTVEDIVVPGRKVSNKSISFTPSSFAAGTAYKVGDYFGYVSKCAAGQFQCINGTSKRGSSCINLSSKCDSINDCSDGSDEDGCIQNGCPGNFQCSDGTCLKRHLVCNGIVECSDGSDEKQCDNWKCEFDEFQCPSGRCIPVVWQCDSKADCDNHTDEQNCHSSCGNDEYLCPEGWCIPLTYKCNGIKECSNGEDEQLCDCSLDEFKCQSGGCVSNKQVCDGLDDCPDRSDEWNCMKLEANSTLLKIRTPSGEFEPVCADNWSATQSDQVCASLGYFSSVPVESNSNMSAHMSNQQSFYTLRNVTNANENDSFLRNLVRTNKTCSSMKMVEVSCQEFSCGSRSMTDSSGAEGRLVGGMTATAGQWPSIALLYNVRNLFSCTANILTPRWVLASYNCLKTGNKNLNEQDWKLFGGSTVFEVEKDSGETRNVVSIVPHPQVKFNQFLFSNDLALVKLDKPLSFSSNTGAVCLPEQEIQPRQICVTAGWGMNNPEDKRIQQQLQYLPVPTMNLTDCNSTEHYSGFITNDKICAGYNVAEKSLCYNEEGAPLMCINDRGEWELQGTLSYHSNCGRGSHPSIFSNIIPVRDWIKQTIGNSFERKITLTRKR